MAEWIQQLESNNTRVVEETKQEFHKQFSLIKEPWLLNGLYEYYLSTNSVPSMEILINVREPHHNYLFDRLSESIKGSKNDIKVQALTLLGHVVRKHPTWLYKITQHSLFKDVLKLLRIESDILLLLSALLVLVVLLPCIPAYMNPYLQEVFEIFSRLAGWNCMTPGKLVEEQMVHMQVGLYALFQRLYGMYPCNFLTYLRTHYRNKDSSAIFQHTIKPMLQTVQMHPLLVTMPKDYETTTERWKKMEAHEVILECERFSLDLKDRFSHDNYCFVPTPFRSRSGTTNSASFEPPYPFLKMSTPTVMYDCDFSPSHMLMQTPPIAEATVQTAIQVSMQGAGQSLVAGGVLQSQEGTSPPEAAIEATPETTPIKDTRLLLGRQYPQQATVVRALNSFGARTWSMGSPNTTPTHSQPSSPMRKDVSSFNFPSDSRYTSAFGLHKRDSYANQKLHKIVQDRSQITENNDYKIKASLLAPTSPLRIIPPSASTDNSMPNSPLPIPRSDSPVSQEDEEVLAIVRQGEITKQPTLRQCDSVFYDTDSRNNEEIEDCEHGSPCTSGGLHMPNSKQMTVFRNKMKRLRYHSQCGADSEQVDSSPESSPESSVPSNTSITVRRANSCPEMKKEAVQPSKDNFTKTVEEKDEDLNHEQVEKLVNGVEQNETRKELSKKLTTSETQTENFWPMPYEHLFLSIFPSIDNSDVKPSPAPSPAPIHFQQEKSTPISFNDILDKWVHLSCQINDKDSIKSLKDQIQLLHQQLLFERHRRETHALRNRTLFTDVTKNKVLEEHNSALTDQVKLQERDIDTLKLQINMYRKDKFCREKAALDNSNYWETKYRDLEKEFVILREKKEDLMKTLELERSKVTELDQKWQIAESALVDIEGDIRVAKEQVLASERGRIELEIVNRELLLCGELILKYQERLSDINVQRKCDQELTRLTEVYQVEIKGLHHQLESKTSALDACRTRISELDHNLAQSEESSKYHKKLLNEVKEECLSKIKAVDNKYQTQLTINRTLEEKVMELYQQIEMSNNRNVHSPDTSSCHEVNATYTDRTSTAPGISPHSSPLSASLASSEGSLAFIHSDVKNLQAIADEKEPNISKPGCSGSTTESYQYQDLPSTSQTQTSKTD